MLFLFSPIVFGQSAGKTRSYYIAVDEVDWDYGPDGVNKMMGMNFDGYAATFMQSGPHSIGKVYRKAIYREYTDASFTQLKLRAPEWEHLGILGPVLRAEVGDTIRVVFRNNATRPYSMHPHGVFYEKASEGRSIRTVLPPPTRQDDCSARRDPLLQLGSHRTCWSRARRRQLSRVALSLSR